MADPEVALLPVLIEKFEPTSPATLNAPAGERKRLPIGTEHFPAGTTANTVCEQIMNKYGCTEKMGLWLLQIKLDEQGNDDTVEHGYKTIKDSKYELQEGQSYFVIHYSGSGMFLFS